MKHAIRAVFSEQGISQKLFLLLIAGLLLSLVSISVGADAVYPSGYTIYGSYQAPTLGASCAKEISEYQNNEIIDLNGDPNMTPYAVSGHSENHSCYVYFDSDLVDISPISFICPSNYNYASAGTADLCYDNPDFTGPVVGSPYEDIPTEKELGCSPNLVGNPCNAATGNKFQTEVDYQGAGLMPLSLTRFYNSLDDRSTAFGFKWRSNFDRRLEFLNGTIIAHRINGKRYTYTLVPRQKNSWVVIGTGNAPSV